MRDEATGDPATGHPVDARDGGDGQASHRGEDMAAEGQAVGALCASTEAGDVLGQEALGELLHAQGLARL